MKNLVLILTIFSSFVFLTSCEKNTEIQEVTQKSLKRTEKIKFVNSKIPAGASGRMAFEDAIIEFVFDEDTEKLVNINVSENYLDYLGMTNNQVEEYVFEQVAEGESDTPHSDCISGCDARFTSEDGTKIPGRGWCKFNCWVDTGVRIIKALVPIIKLV